MARIAMATVIAVVVAVAMVARLPIKATGIMTCNEVDLDLFPCLSYIQNGGDVPSDCCNGLSNLVAAAKTTEDRRTACNCLQSLASGATNDELNRVAALPDKCNISIPYKLSPSTDCSKIN